MTPVAHPKGIILYINSSHSCQECGDPSAVKYCWWTETEHDCNCDECGHDDMELLEVPYCGDCAIELGLAREAAEVAVECGHDPEGLEGLCAAGKVKAFQARGEWWVLVTEIIADKDWQSGRGTV
jgi:hypothetical protein